jgi:hypothetical protein
MKNAIVILAIILSALNLSAQSYPCESSRIGKLVTKPLLKNGSIQYELAVKDSTDPRAKSGKDIVTIVDKNKEDGNVYIARHVTIDKVTYDLLFVSESSGKCIYQVTKLSPDKLYGIRLNADGEVIEWDENTHNSPSMQKEQEKLAKEWLKHFQ